MMMASLPVLEGTLDDHCSTIRPALQRLINELARLTAPIFLVLDDYHLITSSEVHRSLEFLLEKSPSQLHLVLITREDPPLRIPRLRIRRQLLEIRAANLRFTNEEANLFFAETMEVKLDQSQVMELVQRTEGWIAGLQMAALSLREQSDPVDFVNRFAGDDRYIVDFLISEVLEQQPEHILTFLEQTAILDQFSADLCNAVTGHKDGQETIAYLDDANLFIVSLDSQREWFRYHHLFGNLLRYRLKKALDVAEIRALHERAATWYARSEHADEAIQHGLLAQKFNFVADFIESCVTDYMRHGHVGRLSRWFDALPEHVMLARPLLCVYHGWAMVLSGQTVAAQRRMQDAEAALGALPQPSIPLANTINAHVTTLRAYFARRQYQMDEAILLLEQALDALPQEDRLITSVINYNLGFGTAVMQTM